MVKRWLATRFAQRQKAIASLKGKRQKAKGKSQKSSASAATRCVSRGEA
ncbi:MAG: hypothetical protein AB4426_31990 [Xenococcaceae cyanobacterium]